MDVCLLWVLCMVR